MKKVSALLVLCAAPAAAQTTVPVPQQPGAGCQGFSFRMESSSIFGVHDYPQITAVRPGSPAEASGLRVGDLLVKRDDYDLLSDAPPPSRPPVSPGDTVRLLVRREGRDQALRMVVGEIVAGPDGAMVCRLWGSPPPAAAPRVPPGT
jgi:S1-C subfamily serine protease